MDPNQTNPNQGGQPIGTPIADPNAGQTGQDMPAMPETPSMPETPAPEPTMPQPEQPQPEQGQGDQGIGGAPAV
jgi:hypothetical protein